VVANHESPEDLTSLRRHGTELLEEIIVGRLVTQDRPVIAASRLH
jgi:hypothetical protein